MLLLERANFDVLIVALVALAATTSANGLKVATFALIASATLFKFYTFPLLIFVSMSFDEKYKKLIALVTSLVIAIVIGLDLLNAQVDIPRTIWASFGNSFLGLYMQTFGLSFSIPLQNFIGIVFLVLILCITKMVGLQEVITSFPPINKSTFTGKLQMYFMLVFISCYFSGMSFDYRLIFLFIPCILEINRLSAFPLASSTLQILLLTCAWFSLSAGRLQPIGDIAISILIVYFLIMYTSNYSRFGWAKLKIYLRIS